MHVNTRPRGKQDRCEAQLARMGCLRWAVKALQLCAVTVFLRSGNLANCLAAGPVVGSATVTVFLRSGNLANCQPSWLCRGVDPKQSSFAVGTWLPGSFSSGHVALNVLHRVVGWLHWHARQLATHVAPMRAIREPVIVRRNLDSCSVCVVSMPLAIGGAQYLATGLGPLVDPTTHTPVCGNTKAETWTMHCVAVALCVERRLEE